MKVYRRNGDITPLIFNLGSRRTTAASLTQTFYAEEQLPVPIKQSWSGRHGDENCSCLDRNSSSRSSFY